MKYIKLSIKNKVTLAVDFSMDIDILAKNVHMKTNVISNKAFKRGHAESLYGMVIVAIFLTLILSVASHLFPDHAKNLMVWFWSGGFFWVILKCIFAFLVAVTSCIGGGVVIGSFLR